MSCENCDSLKQEIDRLRDKNDTTSRVAQGTIDRFIEEHKELLIEIERLRVEKRKANLLIEDANSIINEKSEKLALAEQALIDIYEEPNRIGKIADELVEEYGFEAWNIAQIALSKIRGSNADFKGGITLEEHLEP